MRWKVFVAGVAAIGTAAFGFWAATDSAPKGVKLAAFFLTFLAICYVPMLSLKAAGWANRGLASRHFARPARTGLCAAAFVAVMVVGIGAGKSAIGVFKPLVAEYIQHRDGAGPAGAHDVAARPR